MRPKFYFILKIHKQALWLVMEKGEEWTNNGSHLQESTHPCL